MIFIGKFIKQARFWYCPKRFSTFAIYIFYATCNWLSLLTDWSACLFYIFYIVDFQSDLRKSESNGEFDRKIALTQQLNPIPGITDSKHLLMWGVNLGAYVYRGQPSSRWKSQ